MFGSLDPAKLLVVLVIALIVIGPERLPKAARQLGSAWRELSRIREKVTEEVRSAIPDLGLEDLDFPHLPRNPSAAVSGFVRDLTAGMTTSAGGGLTSVSDGVTADAASGEAAWASGEMSLHAEVPAPRAVRSPRRLRPGEQIPEQAFVVALGREQGELAVCFDDPAMN